MDTGRWAYCWNILASWIIDEVKQMNNTHSHIYFTLFWDAFICAGPCMVVLSANSSVTDNSSEPRSRVPCSHSKKHTWWRHQMETFNLRWNDKCMNIQGLLWLTSMVTHFVNSLYDDVIKWKHFPRYWPFVRGIHRSPVNSPHKGQWRGALMFFLSAPEQTIEKTND